MADTRHVRDYASLARHRDERRSASARRWKRVGLAAGPMVATVVAAAWVAPMLGLLVGMIGAGVLFFLAIPEGSSVAPDALAGEEGEHGVLARLAELPDDYRVFNRVHVPDPMLPGGRRELDFIIVGPGTVHVVEVKNTPGRIYVQPEARDWPAARRGCCGSTPSWNAMRNPLPQVRAQVQALAQWLLRHGLAADIRPVVCFARPETVIENAGAAPVPVITADRLVETLCGDAAASALPDERVAALIARRTGGGARHAA